ncbi:MAG: hypothetical protein JXA50_08420 [Deltaproteobacteria bacterium]|nr:hypothetical protein [Deltaproteobacteria bacterium]
MSTLTINADLKYIEFILHTIEKSDDGLTIFEMKRMFKERFKTDMPILLNQNFGILRLVPLLLMRESLKNEKLKSNTKYDKRIDIVRHALAHDNFLCSEDGYEFKSDKGDCKMSYDEFVKFVWQVENIFYENKSEQIA